MSQSITQDKRPNARDIPLYEWISFLAEFTRENRGAHARLEIIDPGTEIGYGVETENRPFDGVSADIKDRERTIWIAFGSMEEDHLTHGVHGASVLRVLPPTANMGSVLEIEAVDGAKTILDLTHPEDYALPPA